MPELEKRKVIIVPHGSFVAYLSLEEHKTMTIPYFGNKAVLDWEASRELQREWLSRAGLKLPRQFKTGAEIDRPVIVKLYGAQGGKGYMFIRDAHDFEARADAPQRSTTSIQEYIIGVPLYIHYFYSPLEDKLEIMSHGPPLRDERRLARPHSGRGARRHGRRARPTWSSATSRCRCANRCWPRRYRMGEDVVRVSKEICGPKGLFGAFCIETIITPDMQFYVMEISARIVAGTNLFIDGSPYSYLNYSRADVDGPPHRPRNQERTVHEQSCVWCWMIRAFCSRLAALACALLVAMPPLPRERRSWPIPRCSITQMKAAYDKEAAAGWNFRDQAIYLSTIFNAGRAYSLQRPTIPTTRELATLTVQIGSGAAL